MKLDEIFRLCSESPSGVAWNIDVYGGGQRYLVHKAGDFAGTKNFRKGRPKAWSAVYEKKTYQLHRVVLELNGVDLDGCLVDHWDGDPFNNTITNLRAAGFKENARNARAYKELTKGVSQTWAVGWSGKTYHYYEAYVVELNGQMKRKKFSVQTLGDAEAKAQAIAWRTVEIARLNSLGAGYTERHGT